MSGFLCAYNRRGDPASGLRVQRIGSGAFVGGVGFQRDFKRNAAGRHQSARDECCEAVGWM